MFLLSQLFFKMPHKILKFQDNPRKMHFQAICRPKIQKTFFSVSTMGATQSHWTKQTVKKPNLWGKTAVDKSAWIKAWWCLLKSIPCRWWRWIVQGWDFERWYLRLGWVLCGGGSGGFRFGGETWYKAGLELTEWGRIACGVESDVGGRKYIECHRESLGEDILSLLLFLDSGRLWKIMAVKLEMKAEVVVVVAKVVWLNMEVLLEEMVVLV